MNNMRDLSEIIPRDITKQFPALVFNQWVVRLHF
jgi:hypothetical protein